MSSSFICIVIFLSASFCQAFNYGQHIPQGLSAVNYAYSDEGTWKSIESLHYTWNYYEQWATSNHPFDKSALIAAANSPLSTYTARDANGYLLCDFDRNLEIDTPTEEKCGPAFHEHNGRGIGGSHRGDPFTQFWLDDNWLARYMSQAYNKPLPNGLTDQPGQFMRWKIVGGDTVNWTPYDSDHFDTLSLDGLYFLANMELNQAIIKWDRCLEKSEAFYDNQNQQFEYPGVHENYHMSLWKVLTEMILSQSNLAQIKRNEILQHSVSLRSQILNNQQVDENGSFLGWISDIGSNTALMNTESISCGALGLGANFNFTFEADRLPMIVDPQSNYFIRPYHVVSAVVGMSAPGFLSRGPQQGIQLSAGNYVVQFLLRTNEIVDSSATLQVVNLASQSVMANKLLTADDFYDRDQWSIVELSFEASSNVNVEFRTEWHGLNNLDISVVRLL